MLKNNYNRFKALQHHYVTMAKLYVPLNTTASQTWSCRSLLAIRWTELQDILVNFSISLKCLLDPGLSSWLHISSATRSIFCSVLTVLGRPLPAFREIAFIVSILHRRSLTELTAHFLLENSLQLHFAPHNFSWRRSLIDDLSSSVKGMFINKLWRNNDATLMTLHCVSCTVGSFHLLGSSFGTLENICTKFTHISQIWFYFSVHCTFYLHISLGRCNWLRSRWAVFWPTLCINLHYHRSHHSNLVTNMYYRPTVTYFV